MICSHPKASPPQVGSARSSIPVNYIFPKVASHPKTLQIFLIMSGLLRLNFVHFRVARRPGLGPSARRQRSGPSTSRRRPRATGPSARRQRSGPSTSVQAQAAVNVVARALLRQRSGPCALRRCRPCAAGPSARRQRSGPRACRRRRAAGPSARRQRSGPCTLVQAQVAVNYAMYPKVAGRPKVLSKFSILTGLVRLIFAHPIAVPLKGSSRSHSQVNLIAFISQAKYVAVPPGSGSPFLLFWGGYGPNLRFEKYTVSRVLFSLAALSFPDPDRTVVLGRWSEEIYRFKLQKAEGRPKVLSKIPFLTTFDSRTSRPPVAAQLPRHLPGCWAPYSPKWRLTQF